MFSPQIKYCNIYTAFMHDINVVLELEFERIMMQNIYLV